MGKSTSARPCRRMPSTRLGKAVGIWGSGSRAWADEFVRSGEDCGPSGGQGTSQDVHVRVYVSVCKLWVQSWRWVEVHGWVSTADIWGNRVDRAWKTFLQQCGEHTDHEQNHAGAGSCSSWTDDTVVARPPMPGPCTATSGSFCTRKDGHRGQLQQHCCACCPHHA